MVNFRAIRAGLLVLVIGAMASAQTISTDEIQQKIDSAEVAMGSKSWSKALELFTDVNRRLPGTPRILKGLAVAESQLGANLIAAAWASSYLAADTAMVDKSAIRRMIQENVRRSNEQIRFLLNLTEQSLALIQDSSSRHSSALAICRVGAFCGETETLEKIALEQQFSESEFVELFARNAQGLVIGGDTEMAWQYILAIPSSRERDVALARLSRYCIDIKDFTGSLAAVYEIQDTKIAALFFLETMAESQSMTPILSASQLRTQAVIDWDAMARLIADNGLYADLDKATRDPHETEPQARIRELQSLVTRLGSFLHQHRGLMRKYRGLHFLEQG